LVIGAQRAFAATVRHTRSCGKADSLARGDLACERSPSSTELMTVATVAFASAERELTLLWSEMIYG
jgi:hypothetical protein